MTAFAYALQLPLLSVKDGQGQIRPLLQMLHMMDDHRLAVLALSLAALALPMIQPQHLRPDAVRISAPLRPGIELMLPALGDQKSQLRKPVV